MRSELRALFDEQRFERHEATPFLRALTGPGVMPLSLEAEKDFEYFAPYRFDDGAKHRAMAEWAGEDRCVMVALAGRFDELDEKLAPLAGYEWREVYSRPHKGNRVFGAARLVRVAAAAGGAEDPVAR